MKINLSSLYKRHIRIVPGVKSYVLAASLVLLFGIVVSLLSWSVDRQRITSKNASALFEQEQAIEADIVNRLALHEQILRGASGLFQASDNVTQAEWQQFIKQFELQKTYPGIAAIGYIQYLKADQADAYTQMMRAQGYPELSIMPSGVRNEYAPLTYIEPLSDAARKVIGYDILTDKQRAGPANVARDTGKVSVSEKLILLGDRGVSNQSSFVMYIATYKKGTDISNTDLRREALNGYVFASFRANDFFTQAVDMSQLNAYNQYQIFDGPNTEDKNLIYQSADFKKYDQSKLSQSFTSNVFDRTWTIRFADPAPTNTVDQQRSSFILIGGVIISAAIAGFIFLVMLTRARAIVYSKQDEAQQAKDDLLSLASHQLRTPATAVKQYLGMILEGYTGDIDPQQLPALQKAYASNERQLDTINQILYVAKADAGRLSINKSRFDLNALIKDMTHELKDTLNENDQKLKVVRMSKKLVVSADEASIRMVVENLISNASKYSYSNAVITLETGTMNNDIFISVIDKGVGIAPKDFDQLFKKFSRIDNELSLQVGGSGIGLYIDKVLIELHNGRIEVKSELEKGSTFTIYLPSDRASNLTDGDNNNGSI